MRQTYSKPNSDSSIFTSSLVKDAEICPRWAHFAMQILVLTKLFILERLKWMAALLDQIYCHSIWSTDFASHICQNWLACNSRTIFFLFFFFEHQAFEKTDWLSDTFSAHPRTLATGIPISWYFFLSCSSHFPLLWSWWLEYLGMFKIIRKWTYHEEHKQKQYSPAYFKKFIMRTQFPASIEIFCTRF